MNVILKGVVLVILLAFSLCLNAQGQNPETPAEKAKRELAERQRAVIAQNEKITRENEVVSRAFSSGNAALAAGKYDEAIAEYDRGIASAPNHPGLSSLFVNKSSALRRRGTEVFNTSFATKDENAKQRAREAGKKDFLSAAAAADHALRLLNSTPQPGTASEISTFKVNKYAVLMNRAEAYRLVVSRVDPTQAEAAMRAYKEYWGVEESAEKRTRSRINAGEMLLDGGHTVLAVAEFRAALAAEPSNADAMFGLGLALFGTGDKNNLREASTHLQRFLEKAPADHRRRPDATQLLTYIKKEL
jgi:tetratricopeptide (TPR) repeat protein